MVYSDILYLCFIDIFVNSLCGNLDFDFSDSVFFEVLLNWVDDDFFEFCDVVKGDVVCLMLYMDVCYDGNIVGDIEDDLVLVNCFIFISEVVFGKFCVLF